ncbi:hypothetical protein E0493_20210 [Roseomonas sp. M0104]|uniref:Tripartite tricarboxylate transporter substrate binding protein n=1 Tax=Teichococcus coralli TaxID=2545983 RepID=A0A845BFN6_9PROT|nr:hypothetical protein [Pseudoroseomonas coralli]MXP65678.1 hypothetical protein [Pseudoroseomonas coralli]
MAQPQPAALAPDRTTLLLPGPEGGVVARWAQDVTTRLARGLPHAVALHSLVLGGPDGVTAANRFATMESGEGRLLLAMPGLAAQARLIGESRAQFDPEGWLPICVSCQPAVLAGRGRYPLAGNRPLRLALSTPGAPETAALLALDLLGHPAVPLFNLTGPAAEAALAANEADAMVIASPAALRRAAELGLTPWLELEVPGRRDYPELPSTGMAITHPVPLAAAEAGFAALRLRTALMLPPLTSADVVAAWRRAALRWQEEETHQSADGAALALVGAEARAVTSALTPSPTAVLAYREWLLRRLGFQAA